MTFNKGLILAAVTVSLLSGGCEHGVGVFAPAASVSDYFTTQGCGFSIDTKTKQIRYGFTLLVQQPLPKDGLVEVEFENPLNQSAPLVTRKVVSGDEKTLDFTSDPVKGLRAKSYDIVARLYDSSSKSKALAVHRQACRSQFNQADLPGFQ